MRGGELKYLGSLPIWAVLDRDVAPKWHQTRGWLQVTDVLMAELICSIFILFEY